MWSRRWGAKKMGTGRSWRDGTDPAATGFLALAVVGGVAWGLAVALGATVGARPPAMPDRWAMPVIVKIGQADAPRMTYDLADGLIQWSLRSRGDFDVSEVAKQYGGGGHRPAAGFQTRPGEIEL